MSEQQLKRGRGRPRKDPYLAIRHGVLLQPKFPRAMISEIKSAAASEGLPVTAWIRHLVFAELAERKKKSST